MKLKISIIFKFFVYVLKEAKSLKDASVFFGEQIFNFIVNFVYWQYKCKQLRRKMNESRTFKEWYFHASTLDWISGRNWWKSVKYSDDYDFKTTEYLYEYLKSMWEQNLISGIVHTLRSTLRKNICGIANPVLYEKSNGGTKKLIEDF